MSILCAAQLKGKYKMEPYQQRIIDEKIELDNKKKKLNDFMHGDIYVNLSAVNQGLLMIQLVAMSTYSDVLGRRIELL